MQRMSLKEWFQPGVFVVVVVPWGHFIVTKEGTRGLGSSKAIGISWKLGMLLNTLQYSTQSL